MNKELLHIKTSIIDKIVRLSLLFEIPIFILIIFDIIENGVGYLTIVSFIFSTTILLLFIWKKRITFPWKIHLFSTSFLLLGLSSLYAFNFSSIFYFCFIPVLLNGVLLGKRSAILYLIIVALFYSSIAIGYSNEKIGTGFDHNYQISDPFTWIVFFLATSFVLIIIIIASSELYKYFILTIHEKNEANSKLIEQQDQLEEIVKERTEELQTANEELNATNEELYEKNSRIENQNHELGITLQQLKEAQSQLMQSEKMASLGVMTAGIAHEINNPLNFIQGSVTGLQNYFTEKLDHHSVEIQPFIDALKVGVDRTTHIIRSLNQFSHQEQSDQYINRLDEIVDNCLMILQNKIKNRITIHKNLTKKPYTIFGNTGKIHQVFLNLFINAVQAIEGEGNITITSKIVDKYIEITTEDDGKGMPENIIPKVTDPFFTTKPPGKGTGLGMYITFNIILEHKGFLNIESVENKGTKVTVTLPLHKN